MKIELIILLSALSLCGYAQPGKITFRDGNILTVDINAVTEDTLRTGTGNFGITEISSITFETYIEKANYVYQKLLNRGIQVSFGPKQSSPLATKRIESDIERMQIEINYLNQRLNSFRKQRQTGKVLQCTGLLIVVGSMIVQSAYNKQFERDTNNFIKNPTAFKEPRPNYVSPAVPALGLTVSLVGLGVDFGASGFLSKD